MCIKNPCRAGSAINDRDTRGARAVFACFMQMQASSPTPENISLLGGAKTQAHPNQRSLRH